MVLRKLTRKSYHTAAVLGLGAIGQEIVNTAQSIPNLEQLILTYRDTPEKAFRKSQDPDRRKIGTTTVEYNSQGFEKIKNYADVVIIAIDGNGNVDWNREVDRKELIENNIGPISESARLLEGYEGSVILVTNPPDIMAYLFTAISGIPPERVTGFNYVDQTRIRNIAYEWAESSGKRSNIEILLGGSHLDNGRVPFSVESRHPINDPILLNWMQRVDALGLEAMKLFHSSAGDTVLALKEQLTAMLTNDDRENFDASTYLQLPGRKPIFIGYPVIFKDMEANPNFNLAPINEFWRARFFEAYTQVENILVRYEKRIKQIQTPGKLIMEPVRQERNPFHVNFKPQFPEGARIATSSGYSIIEWNPNNPNFPIEVFQTGHSISSFAAGEFRGKPAYFAGTREGVNIVYEDGKIAQTFPNLTTGSQRRIYAIETFEHDGKKLLASLNAEGYLMIRGLDNPTDITIRVPEESKSLGILKYQNKLELCTGLNSLKFYSLDGTEKEVKMKDKELIDSIKAVGQKVFVLPKSGSKLYCYDRVGEKWLPEYQIGTNILAFDVGEVDHKWKAVLAGWSGEIGILAVDKPGTIEMMLKAQGASISSVLITEFNGIPYIAAGAKSNAHSVYLFRPGISINPQASLNNSNHTIRKLAVRQ